MFVHEYQTRVRYADTDQMGYVYYGNYAVFYEIGRVEAIRSLGISYKDLEDKEGVMMPVLELHCHFMKPARYDDLITVKTIISELPSIKIRFDYEIYNQKGDLLNEGNTTLVFIKKDTHKPCRVPSSIVNALKQYFGR
ncbi:MAG: thioesterase family protein [Flammeovirgaceae bacterium]